MLLTLQLQGNPIALLEWTVLSGQLVWQRAVSITNINWQCSGSGLLNGYIPAHYPCKHHKVYACLFPRQKEKSSLTKLGPVCLKKYLSECKLYTDGQLTANIPASVTCWIRGTKTLLTSYVWPVPLPDNKQPGWLSHQRWQNKMQAKRLQFITNHSKITGQMVEGGCPKFSKFWSSAENPMWLWHLVTKIFAKNHSTKLDNRLNP